MKEYIILLFKQYLRSPYTYFALFLPLIFIIGLGQILPAGLIVPSSITLGISISIFFLFGGSVQEIRKSSLIKSVSLTSVSKSKLFLSNIIISSLLSIFSMIIILWFSFFLDKLGYLVNDLTAFGDDYVLEVLNYSISWTNVDWLTFFYGIIVTVSLSFAMTFLIISLTKTTNSLYIVSFIYIFIMILLGGVIIPIILAIISDSFVQYVYKFVPHYYSNSLLSSSMVTSNGWIEEQLANANNPLLTNFVHALFRGDIININELLKNLNLDALSHDAEYTMKFFSNGEWVGQYIDSTGEVVEFDSTLLQSNLYINILNSTSIGELLVPIIDYIQNLNLTENHATFSSNLWILLGGEGSWSKDGLYGGWKFHPTLVPPIFDNSTDIDGIWGDFSNLTASLPVLGPGALNNLLINFLHIDPYFIGGLIIHNSTFNNIISLLDPPIVNSLQLFFKNTATWDFSNFDSIMNSFAPLGLTIIFGYIGIINFKWSIR